MLVLCAWCEKEGIRMVMKEGDPTGPISHSICQRHLQQQLEEAMKLFPTKTESNPKRQRRRRIK